MSAGHRIRFAHLLLGRNAPRSETIRPLRYRKKVEGLVGITVAKSRLRSLTGFLGVQLSSAIQCNQYPTLLLEENIYGSA